MLCLQRATYFTSLAFLSFLLFITPAVALPIHHRQQDGSQTLTTVTTQTTDQGLVTQTCTIVLTPVTDSNGQSAVQEVKTCTVQVNSPTDTSAASGTSTSDTPVSSISTSGAPDTTPVTLPASASPSASPTSTFTNVPTPSEVSSTGISSTASTASTAPSGSAPVSNISTGSVSNSVTSLTSSAINPVSTSPLSTVTPTSTSSVSPTASSTQPAPDDASNVPSTSSSGTIGPTGGTAAAAESSNTPSSTPFAIPGKKLSVLPIGLGVFAGISVIALIVVGLVTYERTKYRKAFRQRKLAESGAAMGYGGMA